MKWSKRNKDLIKQVIDRYYWMLEKKSGIEKFFVDFKDCPFCPKYHSAFHCLDSCPNLIINKILNIVKYTIHGLDCQINAEYIGINILNKTPKNIHLRLQFWEDALALTKKEFVRKYKKENK